MQVPMYSVLVDVACGFYDSRVIFVPPGAIIWSSGRSHLIYHIFHDFAK